jgi:hypothetical protein
MSSDTEKVVDEFVAISGSSRNEASAYLRRFQFSLSQALNEYFRDQNSGKLSGVVKRGSWDTSSGKLAALKSFFSDYCDSGCESIGSEGIEKLGCFLGVELLDVIWLIIASRGSARSMGIFTESEWRNAMMDLGCFSADELKQNLDRIRQSLAVSSETFRDVYMFSFKYSLDPGHRNLALETAFALWKILLPYSNWDLADKWLAFVESDDVKSKGKAVTKDVWAMLLNFAKAVPAANRSDEYDRDSGAWPIIYDEFYDHISK